MPLRDWWCTGRTVIVRAAALALAALLGSMAARGDDRDLLRSTIADPYLFILLDNSGSMNWSPKGGSCATGDCYVPLQADDPASKFYQAKQALYEVLTDPSLPKVYLGFSTYNQDQLGVLQKHWLYQASSNGVSLGGGAFYPPARRRSSATSGSATPATTTTRSAATPPSPPTSTTPGRSRACSASPRGGSPSPRARPFTSAPPGSSTGSPISRTAAAAMAATSTSRSPSSSAPTAPAR